MRCPSLLDAWSADPSMAGGTSAPIELGGSGAEVICWRVSSPPEGPAGGGGGGMLASRMVLLFCAR